MRHPAIVLKELNASARKSLGQNFLLQTHSTEKALEDFFSNEEWEKEAFLEIGPGLGSISRFLIEKTSLKDPLNRVFFCEYDRIFVPYLIATFEIPAKQITQGDFLEISADEWRQKNIANIIGNLPYYITSPILTKIIKEMPFIKKIFAGVQWDYAQKIKEEKFTSITAFLKTMGEIKKTVKITRSNFYPQPKVDAAWIAWERNPKIDENLLDEYEIFLRGLFWAKRKTLLNSIIHNPHYNQYQISNHWKDNAQKDLLQSMYKYQRSEDLKLQEIIDLFFLLRKK